MRAANRLLILAVLPVAAACNTSQPPQEQNIAIDNVPAGADVEALPPDESSAIPSNQLMNGTDNAEVSGLNAANNAY